MSLSSCSRSSRLWRRERFVDLFLVAATLLAALGIGGERVSASAAGEQEWHTSVDVAPSMVAPGATVRFDVDVTAAASRQALVDIEMYEFYGGTWHKVFQDYWDQQVFTSGQQRRFTTTWSVPASQPLGAVLVKVGIFGAGWTSLIDWNDKAALVTIIAAGGGTTVPPTTTSVPAATTAPPTSSSSSTTSTTSAPNTTTTASATTTTTTVRSTTTVSPTTTVTPSPSAPAGVQFFESFDSPGSVDRFLKVTSFGSERGASPTVSGDWLGDHDMSCGAPTTTRTIRGSQPSEMLWYCAPGGDASKGHMMTATSTIGYGQVDFAPNQVFNNVQRICWDQNLTSMGGRKWTQVAIVPEADFQKNGGRLDYAAQDQMPNPAAGFLSVGGNGLIAIVHGGMTLQTTTGPSGSTFGPGAIAVAAPIWHDFDSWQGATTDDKAARYQHCLSETPQGVRIDRDTPSGHRSGIPSASVHIPQGQVRVIFQDDTYDNFKGDLGDRSHGDDPRVTWHWDNISIS